VRMGESYGKETGTKKKNTKDKGLRSRKDLSDGGWKGQEKKTVAGSAQRRAF